MMRSTIRTIVTGKASVGLATLALLGGGAALASPGDSPPDDAPPAFAPVPLVMVPPQDVPVVPEPTLDEVSEPLEETLVELAPDSAVYPPVIDPVEEDEGPGWALGRAADTDLGSQQERVELFCEARKVGAEEDDEVEGLPPFCTAGEDDGPVPPNAFGQRTAEAARGGERGSGNAADRVGPPPGAGRPDGVPDEDAEGERVGPPEGVPTGPPAGVPGRGPRSDS